MKNNIIRQSAFQLADDISKIGYTHIPIWVYEIKEDNIFPVKFEYKAKGYKGLRFSERLSRIKFD